MKTILVIEDEHTVRESIIDLLEAEGFQGIGGENGNVGIQLAHDRHPDLILCDVTMPDLDGFGVLTQLRQSAETAGIPFIFLSARTTKAEVRQGMALGADDYLTKPCTATELLEAVSGRLAKYEALAASYRQQTEPPMPSISSPTSQPKPLMPEVELSSGTRDGLLNHFYQELRNPLSNVNMAIYFLRTSAIDHETVMTTLQNEYSQELAILQEVYKLQDCLLPESAALLRSCPWLEMAEDAI